eukprot:ANDGO_08185.mRNA.1 Protein YABBY 4
MPRASKDKPAKEDKPKREPSAYNKFMKDELARLKKDHPEMNHKELFRIAANNWKNSPQNPKAGK